MQQEWVNALLGGAIIGLAVTLMLLFNGRVTGISGIVNGAITIFKLDSLWRLTFILGLFFGGILLQIYDENFFTQNTEVKTMNLVIAGLLVGFGTVMGSGCTSGHGVCGISRLSWRSILATLVFMAAGIIGVYMFRNLGVL